MRKEMYAELYEKLGKCYMMKRDYEEASSNIEKMIELYNDLKAPSFIAQGQFNMGLIKMAEEKWKEAAEYFASSVEILK